MTHIHEGEALQNAARMSKLGVHGLADAMEVPRSTLYYNFKKDRFAFEQWLYQTCRLDWCLHELSSDRQAFEGNGDALNYWVYGAYGVGLQELGTYMVEQRLAVVGCG